MKRLEHLNQSISRQTDAIHRYEQREDAKREKEIQKSLRHQIQRDKRAEKIITLIDKHYIPSRLAASIANGDYAEGRGEFWTDDILTAYQLRRHLVNSLASGSFSSDSVYEKFGRLPKIPEKKY